VPPAPLSDDALLSVLGRYLEILQGHPPAEEMMAEILTPDFETGFVGGHLWTGIEGLRDFLSQRSPFFDEKHEIRELLGRSVGGDGEDVTAHTRLHFFLRSWEKPSPVSEEYTGDCFHTWRVREVDGQWRVAAQLVERFADMNDNAQRLFAAPQEGLNT
jgi:SnoaL-like domain